MFVPRASDEVTSSFSGSCCTLPDIRFVLPSRRKDGQLVNESFCDTKNIDEETSDNSEKHP